MKMQILSGGRLRMRKSVYLPDAERHETIDLPVMSFLLRHAQGNVLFDTGCHPSTTADPAARWGTMAKAMTPVCAADENLITQLESVGLDPLDIDVVVNSHFHTDHCGCNEFFKRATVFCHARELDYAQADDAIQNGILPADWKHPMPIETFDGQHDLFGDERIVLVPLPGHTPGMTGARVTLDRDGSFLLASDAVALRANFERESHPRMTWNADQSAGSMQEIRRIQADGTTLIFGHDVEQWNSLRKGADAYE